MERQKSTLPAPVQHHIGMDFYRSTAHVWGKYRRGVVHDRVYRIHLLPTGGTGLPIIKGQGRAGPYYPSHLPQIAEIQLEPEEYY